MIRLAIRGFADGVLTFTEQHEIKEAWLDAIVEGLVKTHTAFIKAHPIHMIELEFLDEPDPQERFFRIGTDPRGMVKPAFFAPRTYVE